MTFLDVEAVEANAETEDWDLADDEYENNSFMAPESDEDDAIHASTTGGKLQRVLSDDESAPLKSGPNSECDVEKRMDATKVRDGSEPFSMGPIIHKCTKASKDTRGTNPNDDHNLESGLNMGVDRNERDVSLGITSCTYTQNISSYTQRVLLQNGVQEVLYYQGQLE